MWYSWAFKLKVLLNETVIAKYGGERSEGKRWKAPWTGNHYLVNTSLLANNLVCSSCCWIDEAAVTILYIHSVHHLRFCYCLLGSLTPTILLRLYLLWLAIQHTFTHPHVRNTTCFCVASHFVASLEPGGEKSGLVLDENYGSWERPGLQLFFLTPLSWDHRLIILLSRDNEARFLVITVNLSRENKRSITGQPLLCFISLLYWCSLRNTDATILFKFTRVDHDMHTLLCCKG